MIIDHKQPSEEQELANAAYVWRKKVQEDLLREMRAPDISLELAEYWFQRWERAKLREDDYARVAKGETS